MTATVGNDPASAPTYDDVHPETPMSRTLTQNWGLLALRGLLAVGFGAIAIVFPGSSVLVFVLLIAAWAIVSGVLYIGSAFRASGIGEGLWLALGGIASLAFGILAIMAPMVGALVVTWWIGAYTIVLGVALVMLAFCMRPQRRVSAPEGQMA